MYLYTAFHSPLTDLMLLDALDVAGAFYCCYSLDDGNSAATPLTSQTETHLDDLAEGGFIYCSLVYDDSSKHLTACEHTTVLTPDTTVKFGMLTTYTVGC